MDALWRRVVGRRSFLQGVGLAGAAVLPGSALFANDAIARSSSITGGDIAILPQYISDNTDDEISHARFLNAYLTSQGATPVNLDAFRTLPSSKATGAKQIGRLTNLQELDLDTSWYTR